MPKARYLKIRFANALFPAELPFFRAAVIEKTQRQSSLFHNHQPPDGFLYRYPLIQYKIDHRKASIVCLNEGTDDIHFLLQERQLNLRIGQREELFTIEDVELRYHNVQAWQARFHYALKDWQALNQENFKAWQSLESEVDRLLFLEKILRSNLLAFASGIGWQAEQQLDARITRFKGERRLPYKGQKVLAFSLNFSSNVSLPDFIGLGKGVSVGFGSVLGIGESEIGNRKSEGLPEREYNEWAGGSDRRESRDRKSEIGSRKFYPNTSATSGRAEVLPEREGNEWAGGNRKPIRQPLAEHRMPEGELPPDTKPPGAGKA